MSGPPKPRGPHAGDLERALQLAATLRDEGEAWAQMYPPLSRRLVALGAQIAIQALVRAEAAQVD